MNQGTSLHEAVSALRAMRADHAAAQDTEARVLLTLKTRARRQRWTQRCVASIGLCLFVAAGGQAAYLGVDETLRRAASVLGLQARVDTTHETKRSREAPLALAPSRPNGDEPGRRATGTPATDTALVVPKAAPSVDTLAAPTSERALPPTQRSYGVRRPRTPAPEAKPVAPSAEELYAEAHRLHFVNGNKHDALVSWERYLAAQPSGGLAPEARYNRSLCLIALGRTQQAIDALSSIAEGVDGDYRQREAKLLLRALRASP